MWRILVVHDEECMRSRLVQMLARMGAHRYEVLGAKCKKEALGVIEGSDVDVVVTDVSLSQPAGQDTEGFEVLKAARHGDRKARVIVITAFGGLQTGVEALTLGAFDYIEESWPGVSAMDLVARKVQLATACMER